MCFFHISLLWFYSWPQLLYFSFLGNHNWLFHVSIMFALAILNNFLLSLEIITTLFLCVVSCVLLAFHSSKHLMVLKESNLRKSNSPSLLVPKLLSSSSFALDLVHFCHPGVSCLYQLERPLLGGIPFVLNLTSFFFLDNDLLNKNICLC